MEKLIRGILNFRKNQFPQLAPLYKKLSEGQAPEFLLFSCSDSRVLPDLVTSTGPGDMFTVRNVGNLVPPCTKDGLSVGDVSEASAIEFAVNVLGITYALVCGHSQCGAMKAMSDGRETTRAINPNLCAWLFHAESAYDFLPKLKFDEKLSEVDRLSQANVLAQLEHLRSYPGVKTRLANKTLSLHGVWFDIETANVFLYHAGEGAFLLLDEQQSKTKTHSATSIESN